MTVYLFEFLGKKYYDEHCATRPQSARLPMSYWTKERILYYVSHIDGMDPGRVENLRKWRLEDLRPFALRYVGTFLTGRPGKPRQMRHTRHYSLDMDNIMSVPDH